MEFTMRFTPIALGMAMAVSVIGAAQARDQISIVGSSTVYPFRHNRCRKIWSVQRLQDTRYQIDRFRRRLKAVLCWYRA